MSSNPLNLALRFILELATIASVCGWCVKQSSGWMQTLLPIGAAVLLSAIWGIFAVPNDPSRSGNAPVPTPGVIRLIIELLFFGLGICAAYALGYINLSVIFGVLVVFHYLVSYDRIKWLLSQ